MRTDVHNSAIDEVYAQDALVWDANTRCFATTAYGNTVSSPLMGSNNLRMIQPSHSGYQPSMTAGHARPSVSMGPRNDDDPNTMAGGVHAVHSNVLGGRAGSMPVLTRDQTYRPSEYNDGQNVQTMRTDQSDRLINDDVRDSQGYESGIQSYARETQCAPISGSVITRSPVCVAWSPQYKRTKTILYTLKCGSPKKRRYLHKHVRRRWTNHTLDLILRQSQTLNT